MLETPPGLLPMTLPTVDSSINVLPAWTKISRRGGFLRSSCCPWPLSFLRRAFNQSILPSPERDPNTLLFFLCTWHTYSPSTHHSIHTQAPRLRHTTSRIPEVTWWVTIYVETTNLTQLHNIYNSFGRITIHFSQFQPHPTWTLSKILTCLYIPICVCVAYLCVCAAYLDVLECVCVSLRAYVCVCIHI